MCNTEVHMTAFLTHKCPAYGGKGVITNTKPIAEHPPLHAAADTIATTTTTTTTTAIDSTLAERGNRYGKFTGHAGITQALKDAMKAAPKWAALADDQREALEMIAHKIGRILNGDPHYHDSWHDIVGYAKLVADRLLLGIEK
mgnify:CR=1 FL=1